MRKNAKTLKQVELSFVQGYHSTNRDISGEEYAYDGFKMRKYFTNDRSIELDENYNRADFNSEATKTIIEELTHSKWAILNKYGDLMTVGNFIESDGNLYSNLSFMDYYQYNFF